MAFSCPSVLTHRNAKSPNKPLFDTQNLLPTSNTTWSSFFTFSSTLSNLIVVCWCVCWLIRHRRPYSCIVTAPGTRSQMIALEDGPQRNFVRKWNSLFTFSSCFACVLLFCQNYYCFFFVCTLFTGDFASCSLFLSIIQIGSIPAVNLNYSHTAILTQYSAALFNRIVLLLITRIRCR